MNGQPDFDALAKSQRAFHVSEMPLVGHVPTIAITPATLPDGVAGAPYSQTLSASGGTGSTCWAITDGALPPGLSLSTSGVISGTPTTTVASAFTVTATDLRGCTGNRTISLTTFGSPIASSIAPSAQGLCVNPAHPFVALPLVLPPVVTGLALPNPTEDVDATFLFLTGLSRQLGHVQYFYASRLFHHHAWARLDDGCVTRAYAWTGETVWQQGVETLPEIKTDVKLFAYGDYTATLLDAEMNFEKVPQLAARWSLDPARVKLNSFRQAKGSAGESAFG